MLKMPLRVRAGDTKRKGGDLTRKPLRSRINRFFKKVTYGKSAKTHKEDKKASLREEVIKGQTEGARDVSQEVEWFEQKGGGRELEKRHAPTKEKGKGGIVLPFPAASTQKIKSPQVEECAGHSPGKKKKKGTEREKEYNVPCENGG